MTPPLCRVPSLERFPHGFLGREGGVSAGVYASLNVGLGSHDDAGHVQENRQRAAQTVLPGAQLVTVHQVHSPTCVVVDRPFADAARPHADALVTRTPGVLLGVLAADCAPILLADPHAGVVGAAHAGWGGALRGVIGATVDTMVVLGADRTAIVAAIGPCIAQRSYEVDHSFYERFCTDDAAHDRFFVSGTRRGHYQFDLEGFALAKLAQAGVQQATALGADTYSQPTRYFSYRRATHAGESDYGRQISLIGLPN